MNKITKTLCMMALVALVFTACKKQETTPTDSVVFNHSMEQLVTVNDEIGSEKVYFDPSNLIAYEIGDSLMLFDIHDGGAGSSCALYRLVTQDEQTLLTVCPDQTALPTSTSGAYYAFYPGGNVVSTNLSRENRATFRLDAKQTYRENTSAGTMLPHNALYIAAKADEKNLSDAMFYCRNICGVLQLNIYSPTGKSVKSIEVTDNTFNIVGDVELRIDQVDPNEMTRLFGLYGTDTYQTDLADYLRDLGYNTTNTNNKVTLECPNGKEVGTTKTTATPFYIVMRPLALVKGCTIKVNFVGGGSKTIKSTKNNVIKPNTIRNMTPTNVG